MNSILSQIRSFAERADEGGRHQILKDIQQLQLELETPFDLFMKLYNAVSIARKPFDIHLLH